MNASRTSSSSVNLAALFGLFLIFCAYLDAFHWTLMDRSWLNDITANTLIRWGMSTQEAATSSLALAPFAYFSLVGMGILFAFSLRDRIQKCLGFPYLLMSQSRVFTPLIRILAGTDQSNSLFGSSGKTSRVYEDDVSIAARNLSLLLSVVLIGYLAITTMQAGAGELWIQSSLSHRLIVVTLLWCVPLIVIGFCPPTIPRKSL